MIVPRYEARVCDAKTKKSFFFADKIDRLKILLDFDKNVERKDKDNIYPNTYSPSTG